MSQRTLKSLFCERFECPASKYEEEVFRRLLYAHARVAAAPLQLLNPNFFADDFQFVARLGQTVNLREAHAESSCFHDTHRGKASFLRNGLRVRISGKKAVKLACQLFTAAGVCSPKEHKQAL